MNTNATKHKKFYYDDLFTEFIQIDEGVMDWLKKAGSVIKKVSDYVIKSVTGFLNGLTKILKKKNNFNNYAYDLMLQTSNINESKKIPYPTEKVIFNLYDPITEPKNYNALLNEFDVVYTNTTNLVNLLKTKFGDAVLTHLPTQKVHPKSSSEIRLFYFNIVSLKTLNDYLTGIKTLDDFTKLEVEAIYGNTSLPLIILDSDKVSSPIIKLPIQLPNIKNINVPVIGFYMPKVNNKEYFAFYMHIISLTKSNLDTNNIKYLNIQFRTKQDTQYVVDIQGEKTLKYIIKSYGI